MQFNRSGQTARTGNIALTFAAAEGRRRYGIEDFNQGWAEDRGWDFDAEVLNEPGAVVTGKFFLKYRRDSNVAIDTNYFVRSGVGNVASIDTNGNGFYSQSEYAAHTPRTTLGDAANWSGVVRHKMQISIARILSEADDDTGAGVAPGINTVYFCNVNGVPLNATGNPVANPTSFPNSISVLTGFDGVATFYLRAGNGIANQHRILLNAVDTTQRR